MPKVSHRQTREVYAMQEIVTLSIVAIVGIFATVKLIEAIAVIVSEITGK